MGPHRHRYPPLSRYDTLIGKACSNLDEVTAVLGDYKKILSRHRSGADFHSEPWCVN